MTPERLRRLLPAADVEAAPAFLSLLDDPRATLHTDSERHSNSTANLLTIYRQRAEWVRRTCQPTVGFDETVQRLTGTPHERLVVLAVGKGEGEYQWCVAFLTQDLDEVVAAIAVLGPPALA
ncbi:hypothetical protein GCM10027053_18550 [Intrasporangium mesophilum]